MKTAQLDTVLFVMARFHEVMCSERLNRGVWGGSAPQGGGGAGGDGKVPPDFSLITVRHE